MSRKDMLLAVIGTAVIVLLSTNGQAWAAPWHSPHRQTVPTATPDVPPRPTKDPGGGGDEPSELTPTPVEVTPVLTAPSTLAPTGTSAASPVPGTAVPTETDVPPVGTIVTDAPPEGTPSGTSTVAAETIEVEVLTPGHTLAPVSTKAAGLLETPTPTPILVRSGMPPLGSAAQLEAGGWASLGILIIGIGLVLLGVILLRRRPSSQ